MFRITNKKGFHLTFGNGITVSIQFGRGNYCDCYDSVLDDIDDVVSSNAEIAVWDKEGNWLIKKYDTSLCDDVKGYVDPDEVADFIQWAKNYKEDDHGSND